MPRKKKEEDKEQKDPSAESQSKTSGKKKKSTVVKYVDPNQLLEEYLDEVINALGLAYLNLSREEYKELIKEPFSGAVGEVKTKPKSRTIINRLSANKDALMEFLAMKLVRIKDLEKLSEEQLEFVVYNTRNAIKDLGPRLYEVCVKRGRNDLIDILRSNWTLYGINSPVKCPKCGFNAIMPDLSCYICRYVISMKQIKEELNVLQMLFDYYKIDQDGFKEIMSAGYFYYSWEGILPPSKQQKDVFKFEIILNKEEKEKLKSFYIEHNTPQTQ
ncbi:hypothetical protein [Stygiolobus caldivivus]|uniref:Uncharacterized protein n=1 Tax=Stygiolobus caldivivus TaxID=2824673 RepID=A0A8D5U7J6_9CREN|nr:hypothetical protein [Stygiolobus caldivivus]BCU71185.1 hypothetical protein KN1_24820 [Stygiolobus caldivivus]